MSVENKNATLTRVYKSTDGLLKKASEQTGLPKVKILELVIKDALYGKRDFNAYMSKLEEEINGIFKIKK
jgi:hypothetical protein|tara:strand:+ start:381 stop:590 length:210 start_codon:yes stop_codon:yes gene_type:complete